MVSSAFAQDKVELNGTYQFATIYTNGQSINSNPGWNVGAAYYLGKSGLGIVGNLSGTDFDAAKRTFAANTIAGGLQYQFRRKSKLRPYVNFLLGDTRYTLVSSTNSLSEQFGGGVDLSLSKHFALRTGVDYLHDSGLGSTSANQIKPIGGIVFRF